MGVTGAFGRFRGLIGKLKSAASGALTRKEGELMQSALWATREALTECFLYQRDPQGKPWAPRKHIYHDYRDTNPILFDLLSYFSFEISDGKVKVTNSKYYAFFHQTGTRIMVARKFVPSSATASSNYADKIKLAAIRAVKGFFA